jgi:hypothetical protein
MQILYCNATSGGDPHSLGSAKETTDGQFGEKSTSLRPSRPDVAHDRDSLALMLAFRPQDNLTPPCSIAENSVATRRERLERRRVSLHKDRRWRRRIRANICSIVDVDGCLAQQSVGTESLVMLCYALQHRGHHKKQDSRARHVKTVAREYEPSQSAQRSSP